MKQVINNINFSNGFNVHHTDGLVTRRAVGIFNLCNTALSRPEWKVGQWCSKYNLCNGKESVLQDSRYQIADESKKMIIDTEKSTIYLELNASNEYTAPRRDGEGWPHLLIEQEFTNKVNIMSAKTLECEIEFTMQKHIDCMGDAKTNIHTAQFSWIFAISDRNTQSKGFDDYIWFGMPFFDSRYDFPPEFKAQDGGKAENTSKFINFINSKLYLSEPVSVGKTFKIKYNLLPEMRNAVILAKERGFLPNSDPANMELHNTNLGWEVTGTFDVGVSITKLSIIAE